MIFFQLMIMLGIHDWSEINDDVVKTKQNVLK